MKGIWLKKLIAGLAVTAMIAGTLSGCTAMDGLNININENGVTVDEKADASQEETGAEEEKDGAELEYWTEGSAAAASITDYVKKVTDESSDDFIPVEFVQSGVREKALFLMQEAGDSRKIREESCSDTGNHRSTHGVRFPGFFWDHDRKSQHGRNHLCPEIIFRAAADQRDFRKRAV